MKLQALYERANTLLREEALLLRQEDPSLPQGKIGYRLTRRSYEKKDGTVSRYCYRRMYYAAEGRQTYLNQKEAARVARVVAARTGLSRVRAELASLVAELNRRQTEELSLEGMREMFVKNREALAEVKKESRGSKRAIEHPCVAADGTVMRSRSEVIVANLLLLIGLLYVYEPVYRTPGGQYPYRRPDFCVLTPKGIVYIEVLGMCSEMNYWIGQQEKLEEYQKAGLEMGKNLLVIEVGDERKINSQVICEGLRDLLIGVVAKEAVAA